MQQKKAPQQLRIKDFSYTLPPERIAQQPIPERDQSKLLVYRNGLITQKKFIELDEVLRENDLLIFNNTRVIHARLLFKKLSGAGIEIFCLEPHGTQNMEEAFRQKEEAVWKVFIGNSKRWHTEILESEVPVENGTFRLRAEKIGPLDDSFLVRFSWDGGFSLAEVFEAAGLLPLPPYIKRTAVAEDESRYQTVYARYNGSVAAPTAGLHFTGRLLEKLSQKKILHDFVTLHVGAGTFKPVKSENMGAHLMHAERLSIKRKTLERIASRLEKKDAGSIIAVGTTSLRTLESLYYFGFKLYKNRNSWHELNELQVEQWEAYEPTTADAPASAVAIRTILQWMDYKGIEQLEGRTQILIAPPYKVKIADALITNFHQPESTLLLLVAAFAGNNWRSVYAYALENDFRFLSYGDSSILFKQEVKDFL